MTPNKKASMPKSRHGLSPLTWESQAELMLVVNLGKIQIVGSTSPLVPQCANASEVFNSLQPESGGAKQQPHCHSGGRPRQAGPAAGGHAACGQGQGCQAAAAGAEQPVSGSTAAIELNFQFKCRAKGISREDFFRFRQQQHQEWAQEARERQPAERTEGLQTRAQR